MLKHFTAAFYALCLLVDFGNSMCSVANDGRKNYRVTQYELA